MGFDDSLLGSARVRIRPDMDGFQREADRTVGAAMKSAAKVAAVTAGAAVAVGAGMVLRDSLKSASDLEQAVGALTAVFGPATAAMTTNAKAAKDVGLSQAQYSQSAAVLGAQLKNLGIAQDQLVPTTDGLMKSAADMAAQFGGTTAEAVEAVSSLMRGERDPIERYGVSMSEASIQAEMAATGFDKTQATLSLLNKQLGASGTAGAAAREFDTSASSAQRMAAQMENAKAVIGAALLPIMAQLSSAAGDFAERNGPAVATAVQSFAGFVREDLMPALKDLGTWLADNVLPVLQTVGGALADNTDKLVPLAAAVAAVWAAWKVYQGVVAVINFAATVASIVAQTGAWVANTAVMVANKVAWLASQALYAAQVVGIVAVTAAQWALNAALSANPIGLIIIAIAAFIAGIVLLYNKNETFRNLVQKVWAAIKSAIGGVIDWFSTWVPAAFENAKAIIGAIMDKIGSVIQVVWQAISWYVTTYVTVVRTVVETVFNVVRTIIENVMAVIQAVIQTVWSAISWYVTTYVTVVKTVVETVFNAIKTVIGTIMAVIQAVIQTVWSAISFVVTTYVNIVRTVVETVFNAIKTVIGTIMDGIRIVISTAWEFIRGLWEGGIAAVRTVTDTVMGEVAGAFDAGLQKVQELFSGAVTAIGAIWDKVTGVVKSPINAMFKWINENMIGPINSVLGKFSDSVKLGTLPTYHTGGYTGDQMRSKEGLALLRNDEYVVNPAATARNRPLLEAINAGRMGFGIGGPGVDAEITAWLRSQGVGNAGIAGILGNLQAESGLNPAAIEGGSGEGHGLVQWSFSRKQDLFDFAAARGTSWTDLGTQLTFLASELRDYPEMWAQLKTATDPRAASQLFAAEFERPGVYGARDDFAAQFYDALQSGALTPESGTTIIDRVVGLAKSAVRAAVSAVTGPALDKLGSAFGGSWAGGGVVGMMRHVVDQILSWAEGQDAASGTGAVAAYDGPGSGALGRPVSAVVTSEFGMRDGVMHEGIDLGAVIGTPIYAAAAGKIMQAGWNGGYGNYIRMDHGNGLGTAYGHMSEIIAQAGQTVAAQGLIGQVGSTGDSTGPHLHFEVFSGGTPVNPRGFVQFDRGGMLQPGWSAVYNGTGRPEAVFTDKQFKALTGGQISGQGHTINVVNHYPQAEPTSVSTSRALRLLATAGGI